MSILIHIVTWNSAPYIEKCIESVRQQVGITEPIAIHVTDNNSTDDTVHILNRECSVDCTIQLNGTNIGYCGGHNQGVKKFLDLGYSYLLLLNPDVVLETTAVKELISAISRKPRTGSACAKLYRADQTLAPLSPKTIDSTGIVFTNSLRHFDRGSDEHESHQYDDEEEEFVFGGTGACLLLTKSFIEDVALVNLPHDRDVDRIYPALAEGREFRYQLFDEAFFAYREDADLAWRGNLLGWQCLYVPSAVGYHTRVVTPERRSELPPELNLYGVRNRFLLQVNNFSLSRDWRAIIPGMIVRNILVILGVLLSERSSLPALSHLWILRRRACARRRALMNKISERGVDHVRV